MVFSAEYQLADAILSEVYKEPLIKDDKIVPDKLRNYKFECFFEHIVRRNGSSAPKSAHCHDKARRDGSLVSCITKFS